MAALGARRARAKRGIPHFSFFILLSALVCLTLTESKLGGGSEKLQTSLLFRSPCTNFADIVSEMSEYGYCHHIR